MLHAIVRKLSHIKEAMETLFPAPKKEFHLLNINDCKEFLSTFKVDEYGHRANISQGDLGYGWMHYGLVRTLRPHNILCIGSRHGYIPALLAQACKDNYSGHVYFVDAGYDDENDNHWSGVGYWRTEKGRQVFVQHKLEEYITLFVMTTEEFSEKYSEMKFDYIYVDGDHSYQGAKRDYSLFWDQLTEYGFMSFHDVHVKETLSDGEYGVHKVWKSIKQKERTAIEFPFLGSGLGLVQKQPVPTRKIKK